jgi:hypothetical protein
MTTILGMNRFTRLYSTIAWRIQASPLPSPVPSGPRRSWHKGRMGLDNFPLVC